MAAFNELIEYLLYGPADRQIDAKLINLNVVILDEPRLNPEHNTFSTNFKNFITENSRTTPVNRPHFFTYFFVGSILSLPYSNILEKYGIDKFLFKVGQDDVLKFVYSSATNGFLRLSFRVVSITNEEVDEVTDMSNYAFTDAELADIINHFQIYPYVIRELVLDFKIFKTFKSLRMEGNFSGLWAIVYPEQLANDLVRICDSGQSVASSSGFVNIRPFNDMEKNLFMEPLNALSGQVVSPESMATLVRTLTSNARILYHTFANIIGALNSVEEFSGFTAGILSLNFHTTYSVKVLIGASLEYSMDMYFKPGALINYDVRLMTPCQIFFLNSDEMDQSVLESNLKIFSRMEYVPHVSTDRKYSIMTVADLNPMNSVDFVTSKVLPLNAPLVHKLLDAVDLIDSESLEYNANAIPSEINVITGKLASTNEEILFNYVIGQLVTAKPKSGRIRLNLLFTFADLQLNDQVKSVITISNGRTVFINVIKNAHLPTTQQFIADQTRRMINEQAELQNVIHIDIIPTAGQVQITIPTFNEQGLSYIGTVSSIGDIDVDDMITQIKDNNVNMVHELLSYALKDLRPHLNSPQMALAFLKGLSSKKYTVLHIPSFTNRLILLEDSRSAAVSSEILQEWLFVIQNTETVADHTVSVMIFLQKLPDLGDYSVQPTMRLEVFVDHLMSHGQFIKVSAPL